MWTGVITTLLLIQNGEAWLVDLSQGGWYLFLFAWLFMAMLWLAFNVVRHADSLASILGEPYGTLILTLSVISIEVIMISAVTITAENNPTLACDMLYSVLMIVLNGMVGVTLIIGALRHGELTENGIEVKVSRKGSDGRMHIAMCGASNGRLNVYSIATESLPRARELGFELLVTRQMTNEISGSAASRRGPALSRTPPLDPGSAAGRSIPQLW